MLTAVLVALFVFNAVTLIAAIALWQRAAQTPDPLAALAKLGQDVQSLEMGLSQKFASATGMRAFPVRRGKDHGVGHRQAVAEAQVRRLQRQGLVEIDYTTLG